MFHTVVSIMCNGNSILWSTLLSGNTPVAHVHVSRCQTACWRSTRAAVLSCVGPASMSPQLGWFFTAVTGDMPGERLQGVALASVEKRWHCRCGRSEVR